MRRLYVRGIRGGKKIRPISKAMIASSKSPETIVEDKERRPVLYVLYVTFWRDGSGGSDTEAPLSKAEREYWDGSFGGV